MFQRVSSLSDAGVVLPTRLMVICISAVALAGLGFIASQGGNDTPDAVSPSALSTHQTPTVAPTQTLVTPTPTPTPAPPVNKAKINVVVFNNTNTKGLAGKTATRATRDGWNILTTDNWHGTVDASTVYYGPKLKAAAQQLATDLGIARIKPSFAPMNPRLLTVILTADYR